MERFTESDRVVTQTFSVRQLTGADAPAIARISRSSPWAATHYTPEEIPRLVATRPCVGRFDERGGMVAFLLATSVVPPSAWLGGFGVPWQERNAVAEHLDALLPVWESLLAQRGAHTVYYAGNDQENDLLYTILLEHGFRVHSFLRAYDKFGTASPVQGNQQVMVRPFTENDLPGVLAIEEAAFEPLWRHDATEFREIATEYPYFVVAELPDGSIGGYQCNTVDDDTGFLVRIAVRPDLHGQGIGARLMAEAMAFFTRMRVARVLLNAEDANTRACRLYEWFGFELVPQRGFVLMRNIVG
jgi:ribosomal-protein-alanine N-acetyltransferase